MELSKTPRCLKSGQHITAGFNKGDPKDSRHEVLDFGG